LRKKLTEYDRSVEVVDLGAGSRVDNSSERKVSQIAKSVSTPKKSGQLLFRICQHYKPKNIIELGTSLGIGTVYLANGYGDANVHTIEGSPEIAKLARANFDFLKEENIESHTGSFDEVLPQVLNRLESVDLAFIDGNHRKEPTLRYFDLLKKKKTNESIFVFDDIHWSSEMYEAWQTIAADPEVTVALDLFSLGIVFFRADIAKQQMSLYF